MSDPRSNYPTQRLTLPSHGLVYPEDHVLSTGFVEIKMPSATEEDILTNKSYIEQGIVFDKLLESVLVTKFNLDDLIIGDKDAILLATRILALGGNYTFLYEKEQVTVNLSTLEEKPLDESLFKKGINEFDYELPITKHKITFKLLTGKDEKKIDGENKGMRKINKSWSGEVTTTLKHMIVAINGNRDTKSIRDFVDTMPMQDSKALKKYAASISPEIVRKFNYERNNGEVVEDLHIPMTVNFFWPE